MIRLNDIVVKFGDFTALHSINVHVKEGEFFTFLGPSGCGKTTTLRTITGFIEPAEGSVVVKGRDITRVPIEDRNIGIVFQNPANQFVTQNVEDEVCVGLRLWEPGLSDEACRQRAEELLDRYGLKRQRRYSPYMLSQGQQRRLAVLSVLAGGQELLLLDEPTSNLDSLNEGVILRSLQSERGGRTVVLVSHRASTMAVADEVYAAQEGRVS